MLNKKALAATAAGPETDDEFNQTVLLLHGDGTNGAQNNTFLDSSTNAFSITRNGNTTQGTFSPFSQTGWSNYFDGTGDYLSGIGTTSSFNFVHNTSGLATIEAWVYRTASAQQVICSNNNAASASIGFCFQIYSDSTLGLFVTKGSAGNWVIDGISTGTVPLNQWVHIAVTYDYSLASANAKFYINGAAVGTSTKTANAATTSNASNSVYVGANPNATAPITGYISNLRISNSIVYSGAFTPSTTSLTTSSQGATSVALLTCQSNRFIDNSTNAFTITVNGNTSVQAFSPFAPTAAYSAATNGGSGYFDGTGDYLTVASNTAFNVGSGDFTEEFWIYPTTASLTGSIIDKRSDAGNYSECPQIQISSNQPILYVSYTGSSWAVTINGSSNVIPYSWNHIAATRSGSTWTLWLNGASVGTATSSGTVYSGSSSLVIGAASSAGEVPITGYLNGVRIVKGTAVYTGAFTPPTAPLTAITNTSLLCNFTNAGIIDQTGKNVLETVGNAQIDTTTKKFGTGSMEFDGTGDSLQLPASDFWTFGSSGNFTIEMWLRPSTLSGNHVIFRTWSATGSGNRLLLRVTSTGVLQWYDSNANNSITTSSPNVLSTSAWNHVAIVRSGSTITLYFNGTSAGTQTTDQDYTAKDILVIGGGSGSTGIDYNGFIDDLRITKGVARYTANFTAPTKAFADQ